MTRDPREGIDDGGFLTTGADLANVRPPYDAVLADARDAIVGALGPDLHGLYLYGSVATGRASPPGSDLDLAAVVTTEAARDRCRRIAAKLSDRHRRPPTAARGGLARGGRGGGGRGRAGAGSGMRRGEVEAVVERLGSRIGRDLGRDPGG
ncbi:MAG: hypothetical protein ACODAE_06450 [Gemmatimonadota bacterium]